MPLTQKEIEDILRKFFPNAPLAHISRAARAIVDAQGQWQEVDLTDSLGAIFSVQCKDICAIGKAFGEGYNIRAFISEK